jgi:hypothetical protein
MLPGICCAVVSSILLLPAKSNPSSMPNTVACTLGNNEGRGLPHRGSGELAISITKEGAGVAILSLNHIFCALDSPSARKFAPVTVLI